MMSICFSMFLTKQLIFHIFERERERERNRERAFKSYRSINRNDGGDETIYSIRHWTFDIHKQFDVGSSIVVNQTFRTKHSKFKTISKISDCVLRTTANRESQNIFNCVRFVRLVNSGEPPAWKKVKR